jgi:hypothetical protein
MVGLAIQLVHDLGENNNMTRGSRVWMHASKFGGTTLGHCG